MNNKNHHTSKDIIVIYIFRFIVTTVQAAIKPRSALVLENIVLRHQLTVYRRTKRPKLNHSDRLFWVIISKLWCNWKSAVIIVRPDTVIRWHRKGFKLFWRWKTRKTGRPTINWELIKLIRQIHNGNPLWSAQRIQGELGKLGFTVCDNTVARYMHKKRPDTSKQHRWSTFLRNHAKYITGIDFLVVRNICFKPIYVFIAISHERRKIVHCAVTSRPYSRWAIQQLRETVAFDQTTKYIIRDNDAIYSDEFKRQIKLYNLKDTPTAPHSPWQNPVAERVIGTLRRECLDHMIILNERHLHDVLGEYISYYNDSRTHLSLDKDSPVHRPTQQQGRVVGASVLGGLHHRYRRAA